MKSKEFQGKRSYNKSTLVGFRENSRLENS